MMHNLKIVHLLDQGISPEEIRDNYLMPMLVIDDKVIVDLDGGFGYLRTTVRDVFSGLSEFWPKRYLRTHMQIITQDEPGLAREIFELV